MIWKVCRFRCILLEVAPNSDYKILPFSGAIDRNGRGRLLKAVNTLGAKAAVNASYFDTSGWIIGNLKIDGEWLGMEDKAAVRLLLLTANRKS